MPFTFAHPAIVMPLKKYLNKYVSSTALILGSMLPDFEYFIRMHLTSEYSHTIAGIFYFDLPLGIILAFIYHNVVRNILIGNLPCIFQGSLIDIKRFNWNKYFFQNKIVVIVSFLVGISSHLLWDSFTHESGFFVEKISLLSYTINYKAFDVSIYKILQHGSTLLGICYIILYILRRPIIMTKFHKANIVYWTYWLLMTFAIVSVWILCQTKVYIGHFAVASISASFLSLILISIIWKYFRKESSNSK